jgi:tetratricopeptide (TPR) repeat protein
MIKPIAALIAALALAAPLGASAHQGKHGVKLYDNLGSHHYPITTRVPQAQRYFDQGLRLYYAFNHAESIRAFEEVARLDPKSPMGHWGIALALGPNINAPMEADAARRAYAEVRKALALQGNPRERALVEALAKRYAEVPTQERSALDRAYAEAMREVVRRFPRDLEARALYAEALMDLSPWNYWARDGSPRENTPELLAQLEHVMAKNPDHPGANHFYIHAVEAMYPERAVGPAERLAGLMPGAGHIVHMPGHIYIRVGRYADAIQANEHAIHADETYIRDANPAMGIYVAGYYPHNYDFLAFAASMIGREAQAIAAAEKMPSLISPEMLTAPGMAFAQKHFTRHLEMKVRFARWDDISRAEAPTAKAPFARAMWHYARGRAHAAKGDIAAAQADLAQVRAARDDKALAAERLEFNTAGQILGIAAEVLAGHIAQAKDDDAAAIDHLRVATRIEDELTYGEPPEWSVPVRQELGRVLIEAGHLAEAEQAFREDLKRFPDNTWSLAGLQQASRGPAVAGK